MLKMRARENLNKFETHVHAAGGKSGASVLNLKINLLSSRCRVAVPPFTCLITDTLNANVPIPMPLYIMWHRWHRMASHSTIEALFEVDTPARGNDRRICSDDGEYDIKLAEMASFFENRGYPRKLVTTRHH